VILGPLVGLGAGAVVDDHAVPGLGKVARHGASHDTKTKEGNMFSGLGRGGCHEKPFVKESPNSSMGANLGKLRSSLKQPD
jgi:hypothetical protein